MARLQPIPGLLIRVLNHRTLIATSSNARDQRVVSLNPCPRPLQSCERAVSERFLVPHLRHFHSLPASWYCLACSTGFCIDTAPVWRRVLLWGPSKLPCFNRVSICILSPLSIFATAFCAEIVSGGGLEHDRLSLEDSEKHS